MNEGSDEILFEEGKVYEVRDSTHYYVVRYGETIRDTWGVNPQSFKKCFYSKSEMRELEIDKILL